MSARLFQNYKALQFLDTLALYFNRIHPSERVEQTFESVPISHGAGRNDYNTAGGTNNYQLSPFPLAATGAEFAFCGRRISPSDGNRPGGWPAALRQLPTEWEHFRLVGGLKVMLEIDIPEVLRELVATFETYERALTTNDIETVNSLFWDSPSTVRYGTRDPNAITGIRKSPHFEVRAVRSISPGL